MFGSCWHSIDQHHALHAASETESKKMYWMESDGPRDTITYTTNGLVYRAYERLLDKHQITYCWFFFSIFIMCQQICGTAMRERDGCRRVLCSTLKCMKRMWLHTTLLYVMVWQWIPFQMLHRNRRSIPKFPRIAGEMWDDVVRHDEIEEFNVITTWCRCCRLSYTIWLRLYFLVAFWFELFRWLFGFTK